MSSVLTDLLDLLKLEKIEQTIFRGQSQDLGFGNVFGGQVIGQALSAAQQTVDESRSVHSFHCYFLLAGDPKAPIVYNVDCIRDGKSFNTRRVVAIQHGRPIFNLSASFQVQEEGLEHQDEMPDGVPGPDGLASKFDQAKAFAEHLPEPMRTKICCEKPIEIRVVDPINPLDPQAKEPKKYAWFRAIDTLPDDPRMHKYLLAYASDFDLIVTSLHPHGRTVFEPEMQVATIDHAMWFHRDFRLDDWLLYSMESPSAQGARGLVRGQFFDRQGRLVASTIQEGLIRDHKAKK